MREGGEGRRGEGMKEGGRALELQCTCIYISSGVACIMSVI